MSAGAPTPEGGLRARARELLAAGPLHTVALAESILHARGGPSAGAGAVYALLGADPAFEVDARGVWSLAAPPAPPAPAPSLWEEEWVVVDVETTGGSAAHQHRVIEVAAVPVCGGVLGEPFSALINPERSIPPMIRGLTGIHDGMVAGAPRFHEVAPQLEQALRGRVFVAHNAPFDWRFVSAEMERALGRGPEGRQLCTVRLSRKLLPQLPSRALDALVDYFGLEIASRHRALGDAVATAHLLLRLLDLLADRGVENWAGLEALLRSRTPRRKRRATPRSMDRA